MLKHRLLLGPVLIIALCLAVWLDESLAARFGVFPGSVLLPILLLVGIGAGLELVTVFKAENLVISRLIVCASIVLGILTSSFSRSVAYAADPGTGVRGLSIAAACTAAIAVLLGSLLYYSRHHNVQGVVASSAASLLAFVYVGLMGGFILLLRTEFSGWVLLAVLLITKSMDIGAYFTGRSIGRHKLIPWLSPGKTWEGLLGGLLLAGAVGAAAASFSHLDRLGFPVLWWHGAVFGAFLGMIGQAGDLLASLLKRDAGLKDYSQRLPGFGGVLDVIDSPLLVAPVAYWCLTWLAAGR